MLVFGDARRLESPVELIEGLARSIRDLASATGLARQAAETTLLVELGMLAQGLADALPNDDQHLAAAIDRLMHFMVDVARGGRLDPELQVDRGALLDLKRLSLPREIIAREPEGYAFYALYPELYRAAAESFQHEVSKAASVVGVRSIGTSLAAAVAAGLGRVDALLTVRPEGPPFERHLTIEPARARALVRASSPVLVVDEGPGLSGSTFAAVGSALEASGVARARIHFFTGHGGEPGPYARPEHRAWLRRTPRHHRSFEEHFLERGAPSPLTAFFEPELGPSLAPIVDLSGGSWRHRVFQDVAHWPGVDVRLERRKFLLETCRGAFLLKFAGLDRAAAERVRRAEWLGQEGFVLPPRGHRRGFVATPWRPELRPLDADAASDPERLAARVASYLSLLRAQPEARGRGASPHELLAMARRNLGLALGASAAEALDRFEAHLPGLTRDARPIAVDGKMQRWEWLVAPDGTIWKADAFDHHAGHDLVGCQDIAWDVAGALVELPRAGAMARDVPSLLEAFERKGLLPSRRARRFYEVAYLAFQLGRATLSAESLEATHPDETRRLEREARRYSARLRDALAELDRGL